MKSIKHVLVLASIIILAASCSSNDDDPEVVNEEELITTVSVTLTSTTNADDVVTLKRVDLDGDGPEEPDVTVSGNLTANTTYTGETKVLNETEDPAENVTEEVLEEGVDHQFFYQFESSLGSTTYSDTDENGNPIGIDFTLTTADAGDDVLTVTLRHQPNKGGDNVVEGDITNANGETDAQAVFNITIE